MKFSESTKVLAGTRVWSAPLRVLRVPFSNSNTAEIDTKVRFMKGDLIEDCRVVVTTAVASSTIDVGLNGTTHDDPDGLVKAVSCAAAGYPAIVDNTETASKMGALLQSGADSIAEQAANEGGPSKLLIREDNCPLTYTTTNHAIAGYILVFFRSIEDGANYAS